MIRYRRSLNRKRYQHEIGSETFRSYQNPRETVKFLGSGGSMVARLKLEGIDGEIPQDVESAAQFDSTRQPYQTQMLSGTTD